MTRFKRVALFAVLLLTATESTCTYNTLHYQSELIKTSWAQVLIEYQRRADLIPGLANLVKNYAAHETTALSQVANARADLSSIRIEETKPNDHKIIARYEAAQTQMRRALSRLIATAEDYPELRANQAFRDLQAQLEGTENRIAYARQRYIESVQAHNLTVRTFPNNLLAKLIGQDTIANFTLDNEIAVSVSPKVNN
ncbi:MAG: LemA family protein [Gammaproteobacteria bacterium]|nr:LemA family protein [Gammaproteobacteria bacterium]